VLGDKRKEPVHIPSSQRSPDGAEILKLEQLVSGENSLESMDFTAQQMGEIMLNIQDLDSQLKNNLN
jgi:hypothetical protein